MNTIGSTHQDPLVLWYGGGYMRQEDAALCFYYGGASLKTTIDKEELVKWVKGTSALSTALAVMGESGSEVPPEADYVIGQILNMIADTID